MNGRNNLLIGLTVLVMVAGLVVYRVRQSGPAVHAGGGSQAPDIVTKTLDGETWRLRDQQGKVLLVDFWATWCGPCVASMPHMKQVYDRFKSNPDFAMVGVSLDYDADAPRAFVKRQEIPWLQLYDPEQPFARAFNVTGIPSVWVFGRDGRAVGGQLNGPEIERTVAAELARK